jgi:hypothetical protein
VVVTPWGFVDPSYGKPASDTPYSAIAGGYEPAAIAGFAVVYFYHFFHWAPAKSSTNMINLCAMYKCEFRAVPYNESGAP